MSASPLSRDLLSRFFREHHRWLLTRLSGQLRNRWDAEDLAAETFTQIAASPVPLSSIEEPRAYLTTIAKRLLFHLRRRRDLEQAWLEQLRQHPEAFSPSPETRTLLLETVLLVDRAMQSLPPPARAAFLYSQLDGLDHETIAARLGVSVRTVGRYLRQAWQCCINDLRDVGIDA